MGEEIIQKNRIFASSTQKDVREKNKQSSGGWVLRHVAGEHHAGALPPWRVRHLHDARPQAFEPRQGEHRFRDRDEQ